MSLPRVFGFFFPFEETGTHGTSFPSPLEWNLSPTLVAAVSIAPLGAESQGNSRVAGNRCAVLPPHSEAVRN